MVYPFKACREMRGYTQKYVALSLGVKAPSVSDWEKGKTNPTLDNLISLAELLDVSIDMLLGIQPLTPEDCNSSETKDEKADDIGNIRAKMESLNEEGQEKVLEYMDDLISSGKYIKSDSDYVDQKA